MGKNVDKMVWMEGKLKRKKVFGIENKGKGIMGKEGNGRVNKVFENL